MPGIEDESLQLCMWLKSPVFGDAFFFAATVGDVLAVKTSFSLNFSL